MQYKKQPIKARQYKIKNNFFKLVFKPKLKTFTYNTDLVNKKNLNKVKIQFKCKGYGIHLIPYSL